MSILIKGIEKPKDCGICPFELDGWPDEYVEICKLLDRQVGYFGEESEIPSDCPIVDVPTPHGRLIDADKLRKALLDLQDCYNGFSDTYDKACIIDLIDEQPTIIEAEEGEGE